MMIEKHDHITPNNIKQLIEHFYKKVRQNPDLGPIFEQAIGTEAAAWQPHLDKMVDFWSSIMLGTKSYHGTPMQKHLDLFPFDLSLFDHWLAIFLQTAQTLYTENIALNYHTKSKNIAKSLKLALSRKKP